MKLRTTMPFIGLAFLLLAVHSAAAEQPSLGAAMERQDKTTERSLRREGNQKNTETFFTIVDVSSTEKGVDIGRLTEHMLIDVAVYPQLALRLDTTFRNMNGSRFRFDGVGRPQMVSHRPFYVGEIRANGTPVPIGPMATPGLHHVTATIYVGHENVAFHAVTFRVYDSSIVPPADCQTKDFRHECEDTPECQTKYPGADDCSRRDGGVCFCQSEVCGCMEGSTGLDFPFYKSHQLINAGSALEDSKLYRRDSKAVSTPSSHTISVPDSAPFAAALFQSQRVARKKVVYKIPGFRPHSNVTLTVGLADTDDVSCAAGSGSRVLDVKANGMSLASRLDVLDQVGCRTAVILTKGNIPVNDHGNLKVVVKARVGDPFVSVIEIQA